MSSLCEGLLAYNSLGVTHDNVDISSIKSYFSIQYHSNLKFTYLNISNVLLVSVNGWTGFKTQPRPYEKMQSRPQTGHIFIQPITEIVIHFPEKNSLLPSPRKRKLSISTFLVSENCHELHFSKLQVLLWCG